MTENRDGKAPLEIILKNRLNAEDGRELSEAVLKKHLSLEVEGHKLTTEMALNGLAIVPTLKRNPKTGKSKRTWLVNIVTHLDWSAKKVQQRYRRCFGIESSYRQLGQARAHTNSRNLALRFFFLALLLIDLWVFLRCLCTRAIGRGPFRLEVNRFRLAPFTAFLGRAIEDAYGTTMSIPIYSVLPIP